MPTSETIKSIISKRLKALEHTGRIKVFNFSFNKHMPSGTKGFPDFLILSKDLILFVELKIGRDRLRKEQEEFKQFCEKNGLNYRVIKENEVENLINEILETLD